MDAALLYFFRKESIISDMEPENLPGSKYGFFTIHSI
jgi:hypothetical protein